MINIFIPAKNEDRFIARTIDSVLSQTFEDFKLIISNNHSTDRTQEIIDEYVTKDPRVVSIMPNRPMNAFEHAAFARTWFNQKYHLFVGAHDVLDKNYVLKTFQAMEDRPNLVVASSHCLHFTNDNKVFQIPSINFDSTGIGKLEKLCIYFQGTAYNHLAYGLFRTELTRGVVIPNVLGVDHLELASYLMKGDCYVVPEDLIYFRYPENAGDQKRQVKSLGVVDGAKGWRDLFIALRDLIDANFVGVENFYAKQMIKGIYMTHYLYMTSQLGISVMEAAQIAEEVMLG